jgi:hypothetical protein
MGITCDYKNIRGAMSNATVTPNPAPVTGEIIFDSIDTTGAFRGKFRDISSSVTVTAAIPALKQGVPVTVTIASDPVTGMFLWGSEKVIFDTSTINILLTIGSQTVPIPASGIRFPATFQNNRISIIFNTEKTVTYMGIDITCALDINLVATLTGTQPSTSPWISLRTNQQTYVPGQVFKLVAGIGNPGPDTLVDIYLALHMPDGSYTFFPAYSTDATPAVSNWLLAGGSKVDAAEIYSMVLPASTPPISAPGKYQFLAAMFKPGTTSMIGDLAVADFTYNDSTAPAGSFDGIWLGSGKSAVPGGDCPDLANVQITVENNQIVEGWAEATLDGYEYDGYAITGAIAPDGTITNGFLWEEYKADLIAIGTYDGAFSATSASGTWQDAYGCYGTFKIIKNSP